MDRRALIIGIGAAVFATIIGLVVWLIFFSSSPGENLDPTPTPEPIETGGELPITSNEPFVTSTPTPSPSSGPISFVGVCPDTWVSQQDTDRDSLPDSVEAIYAADSNKTDTDGDGYNDGEEVRGGYNPTNASSSARLDSDSDGLLEHDECNWGTDPFNPDSDGDGFKDGAEVTNGFDPTKKGDGKGSDKIVLATPIPTSTPFIGSSQPTPTPNTGSFPTPTQIASNAQLPLVPISQLKITGSTAPADVKTYLTQIDALRPAEFSDGQIIASAIQNAANGNVQPLSQVRIRIAQFAAALKGTPTPRPAQDYQQLYVSLIEFTASRLQAIEQNATGSNQQVAVQAVLDIQNILPSQVSRLSQLRQAVEGIANQ